MSTIDKILDFIKSIIEFLISFFVSMINAIWDLIVFIFIGISMMFVIFIIIGIVSIVKAGGIKKQIPEEEAQTEEIMNWLSDNMLQDNIDKWKDETVSAA